MAVRMGHGEIGELHASFGQFPPHDFDKKDTVLRATVHQEGPLCSDQEKKEGGLAVDARGLSENEGDRIQGFDPNGFTNLAAVPRREPGLVEHREPGRGVQRNWCEAQQQQCDPELQDQSPPPHRRPGFIMASNHYQPGTWVKSQARAELRKCSYRLDSVQWYGL